MEKNKQTKRHEKKMVKTSHNSIHEDVFMFDSFSQPGESLPQAKGTVKQSTADLTLPLLIGGVLLLTLGLCVWMVVYGVRARKRWVEGYSHNCIQTQHRY